MLFANYRGEETFASELPNEVADINTCDDGLEHYPRCPDCGERVTHHNESINGRAAHFAHCGSGGGGGGGGGDCSVSVGEKQEHKAMKSIATSALEFALSDVGVEESDLEVTLKAPWSDKESRQADCLIEFEERDEQLGNGLIVEIQYRNKSKDKNTVMADYLNLDQDYSVLWLWPKDFHTNADSPAEWNCRVVHEETVRDRVRSQIWPPGEKNAIWSDSEHLPAGYVAGSAVGGLSSSYEPHGPHPSYDYYIQEVANSSETDLPKPKLAGTAVDSVAEEYKQSIKWESLFNGTRAEERIDDLRQEFDLPKGQVDVKIPHKEAANLVHLYSTRNRSNEPERPSTPFDDIQCWQCGCYWYAHSGEERYYCQSCGAPVDIGWNVQTGRVSEVPYYPDNELTPNTAVVDDE